MFLSSFICWIASSEYLLETQQLMDCFELGYNDVSIYLQYYNPYSLHNIPHYAGFKFKNKEQKKRPETGR